MKHKSISIIFLLLFFFVSLFLYSGTGGPSEKDNKKKFRKTMKLIDKGEFRHAEANLLELWKTDSMNLEYNYELALLYFYDLKMSEKALKYFLRVQNIVGISIDEYPELHYYLGQTYQFSGEYEKAINEYMQCNEKELQIKDEIAGKIEKEIAACKYAMTLTNSPDVRIRNLGNRINTWYAEYVPVPVKGDSMLLFTSIRPPVISTHYGFEGPEYFEKIYISRRTGKKYSFAEPSENFPEFLGLNVKPRKHNAVVGMNYEGNILLLYRKNKLWTSEFTGGKWQPPVKIQKSVNFSFYQPHVSVTRDGNTLFFSSWSKKTGFGNLDIYMCKKDEKGQWGQAVNLGSEINTPYNEDSPEISPDGKTLYFSSQGHQGIGGFDIFKSENINGNWTKPVSMGIPVNSSGDDIFFRFSKDGRIAYFSSYRKDGVGNMDIYEAEFSKLFYKCGNQELLDSAANYVTIGCGDTLNAGENILLSASNLNPGKFHFSDYIWKVDTTLYAYQDQVNLVFTATGMHRIMLELNVVQNETKETETYCISKEINVMTREQILAQNNSINTADSSVQVADTSAVTIAANNTVKDTSTVITNNVTADNNSNVTPVNISELQNVYFEFNNSDVNSTAASILDKNIELLNSNTSLKIIITAHADPQGDAEYNKLLSERRAKSVFNYIVSKGIDKSRITQIKGMGETVPPVATADAPVNTIKYYKLSRRSEIKVVK